MPSTSTLQFLTKSKYIVPTGSLVRFVGTAACGCLATKNKNNAQGVLSVAAVSQFWCQAARSNQVWVLTGDTVTYNGTFVRILVLVYIIIFTSLGVIVWCRDPEIIIKKQMEMYNYNIYNLYDMY